MPSILVVCAHSDDQIFGAGGTLAKYADEGYRIKTVVLSYGETGTFWIKEHITIQTRMEESEHADKIIRGSGVTFFDLKEGKFEQESEQKKNICRTCRHYQRGKSRKNFYPQRR